MNGRRGGVVTQRTANPWTPVRIRSSPPFIITTESKADYNAPLREQRIHSQYYQKN